MVFSCDACGSRESANESLVHLHELDSPHTPDTGEIALCLGCMTDRAPASWEADSPEGQRLLEALASRGLPTAEHYTYLGEHDHEGHDNIHLVMLDPNWVHRRSEAHAHGGDEEVDFEVIGWRRPAHT